MCAKLLILESPGKVKKVQEILGSGWKVAASVGHVRDLPPKEMGVAEPEFKPHYVPTERGADVLKRLAGLVKGAEAVFLATDPDREGEAIAWHLAEALKLKNSRRITYAEITEAAIKAALTAPRDIDMALVAPQEGRRVLDRFCGYMVSGPLSDVAGTRLSAGRVQSPAVRAAGRGLARRHFAGRCCSLRHGQEIPAMPLMVRKKAHAAIRAFSGLAAKMGSSWRSGKCRNTPPISSSSMARS